MYLHGNKHFLGEQRMAASSISDPQIRKVATNGKSLWKTEIAGPSWNDGAGGSLEKQTAVSTSTQSFLP